MHDIRNDLPKQVQARGVEPLRVRLADAVDLTIQPSDEVAVSTGDFIPQEHMPQIASPRFFH